MLYIASSHMHAFFVDPPRLVTSAKEFGTNEWGGLSGINCV